MTKEQTSSAKDGLACSRCNATFPEGASHDCVPGMIAKLRQMEVEAEVLRARIQSVEMMIARMNGLR